MNNQGTILFGFLFLLSAPLFSATRPALRTQTDENTTNHQQVVMVPVSIAPRPSSGSAEEQRDREFFLTLLSIASHFGNALLNRENKPVVAQHIGYMTNGIVQAAEIITRYGKQGLSYEQLCAILSRIFNEQAQQNISRIRTLS